MQIRNTRQTEYSITQHTLRLNNTMLVFNLYIYCINMKNLRFISGINGFSHNLY